jgi:hypothetical protein
MSIRYQVKRLKEKSTLVIIIMVFAFAGALFLLGSYAGTPYFASNADQGTLSGATASNNDTTTLNGQAVQFGCKVKNDINPAPCGPLTPSDGWHVVLADDFNAPIGTAAGDDNLWVPEKGIGSNADETELYDPSQVSVSGGNLVLTANYDNDAAPATGDAKGGNPSNYVQRNYLSGEVNSFTNDPPYKGFTWTPDDGSTWAFEIDAQWPVNPDKNMFNAWWTSSQNGWVTERDFFEGTKGSPAGSIDTAWIYQTRCTNSPNCTTPELMDYYSHQLISSFNPADAMHRYTYVIFPNQSWSLYIDGVLQNWVNACTPTNTNAMCGSSIAPPETSDNVPMRLRIDYALNATTFTTGSRQFLINSVAVYQDNNHAGKSMSGGGVAPGTVVGN